MPVLEVEQQLALDLAPAVERQPVLELVPVKLAAFVMLPVALQLASSAQRGRADETSPPTPLRLDRARNASGQEMSSSSEPSPHHGGKAHSPGG